MEWPTFTSASLRETEIADGLDAGRRPSTRFFERWPRKDIGAAFRLDECVYAGEADASGTGPRRFVALDIGNAVDRSAAHLPCATALARAGSGANRDVYRRHRGASCFPHTVGDVGGCKREGRVGRRLHPVCDLAGAAAVPDY